MNILLHDILTATSGTLLKGVADTVVGNLSTDTRTLREGDVFLALEGENFDGNIFINDAIETGAGGVIGSDLEMLTSLASHNDTNGVWLMHVEDCLTALGDIAALWRGKVALDAMAVIAGSAGKTTTKEMVASVVARRSDTLVSEKNFNNLIGVPLNLLKLQPHHERAVLEIGMNQQGELRRLTQITSPDIAAYTNIGRAHIGQFDGEEGLLDAKGELLDMLDSSAMLIYNADCALTRKLMMKKPVPSRTLSFGIHNNAAVMARDISHAEPCGFTFTLTIRDESERTSINIFGQHNIYNALCAAAVLSCTGVGIQEIARGLQRFQPFTMRSQIEQINDIYLVVDCYNSSPDAVIESLKSLKQFAAGKKGRTIAVLGDMLELGAMESSLHREIGESCLEENIDVVVTVGKAARGIVQRIAESKGTGFAFRDQKAATQFLEGIIRSGDVILFKASRLLAFENIVESIRSMVNENHHRIQEKALQEI